MPNYNLKIVKVAPILAKVKEIKIMYGNKNGSKVFSIPVEWVVTETIDVKANSLKEAINFILDKADDIPLGTEPQYIDGTWKISADENNSANADEILKNLNCQGYIEREAEEFDEFDWNEID